MYEAFSSSCVCTLLHTCTSNDTDCYGYHTCIYTVMLCYSGDLLIALSQLHKSGNVKRQLCVNTEIKDQIYEIM